MTQTSRPSGRPRLATAPWPAMLANENNTSSSPVRLSTRGEAAWSASLPGTGAAAIVVGADGRVYVLTAGHLTAVAASGDVEWSVEVERRGTPVLTDDGYVLLPEASGLVLRDRKTGGVAATTGVGAHGSPAFAPDGRVVCYVQPGVESSVALVEGEGVRWSIPLPAPPRFPPLVQDDVVIVPSGAACLGVELDGAVAWTATHEGFSAGAAPSPDGSVDSPIVGLGGGRFLAGTTWYTGFGFHVFDTHARRVQPLAHLPVQNPIAVPRLPSEADVLATAGFGEPDADDFWRPEVVLADLEGGVLWREPTPSKARAVAADAAGNVVVACTPTEERWEYRRWPGYDLDRETFVRCYGPTGREVFTWYAPGLISSPVAIGSSGEVLVVVEDALWAIA